MSIPFINVQISNEDGFIEVEDKNPTDETIHTYIDLVARALRGLTFLDKSITAGFQEWIDNNGVK